MPYINTINNYSYNQKERELLCKQYDLLHKEWETRLDQSEDIEDDDEYNKTVAELDRFLEEEVRPAQMRAFAAQFKKVKNEWFEKVIDGFKADGNPQFITKRQYECFGKYACCRDGEANYCRVSTKLVELHLNYIKVYQL